MRLAIVGVTGAVGQEMLRILEQRRTRFDSLRLFASERSTGKRLTAIGRDFMVEPARPDNLRDLDFALFSAGAAASRELAPVVVQSGGVVIDNSSAFRMDAQVPLAIPEINREAILGHRGIVAVPNCTAIILCMAIAPLRALGRFVRVIASTYQAVSGAGAQALAEYEAQMKDLAAGRPPTARVLPYPIAGNLFSHNTAIGDDGYNGEEAKVIQETRKILGQPDLALGVTCVRVPVARAHSEAIHLTFDRPVSEEEARAALTAAHGVRVVDDRKENYFPMPIDAGGRDEVLVGRIRRDVSDSTGRTLALFACGDQLRKGAALDAVQILEILTNDP